MGQITVGPYYTGPYYSGPNYSRAKLPMGQITVGLKTVRSNLVKSSDLVVTMDLGIDQFRALSWQVYREFLYKNNIKTQTI